MPIANSKVMPVRYELKDFLQARASGLLSYDPHLCLKAGFLLIFGNFKYPSFINKNQKSYQMFNKIELSAFESGSDKKLILILSAAFLSLFAIVGFAYYGMPFYFDFMSKELGWSRATLTSGNAIGKVIVGPLFGFFAGWMIDRHGPRRMIMVGGLFAGISLIGLSITNSLWMFYSFYIFNALGYVFGGPLPCQVLLSRWFDKNRGKAMGIAYLGIGIRWHSGL